MDERIWQWTRTIGNDTFLISSDKTLLPHSFVQEAFATEAMYWTKPISTDEALRVMLSNSLTLGLYALSESGTTQTPIGMARMVTDYTTLAYLTDVYVQQDFRALGLGRWIIHCCRQMVLEMPDLRFMVLLTGSEQAQQLYRKEFGMKKLDGVEQPLVCMGGRFPGLTEAAATTTTPPTYLPVE